MAFITFYDTNERDKEQLTRYLNETDHHWEYVSETINSTNLKQESEVISVFITSKVTRDIIEKLPRLKLIACRSTGYNNVDLDAAAEHGITVVNVPTYGEHTVAEYTFSLILALSRRLRETMSATSTQEINLNTLTGFDLYKKKLGIIGMGRIGQQTAVIAKGFGMDVLAFDPYPNEQRATQIGFTYTDIEHIANNSDIISLHAPYTKDNYHIVDDAFLHKIKPTALLVNTSRGELVDSAALVRALQEKRISGAALDVLEGEQMLKLEEETMLLGNSNKPSALLTESLEIHILERFPNVIITPHTAFNTQEAIERINQTSAQNIIRYWYGEVPNKVNATPTDIGKLVIIRHGESEWNALGKWTGTTDVHLTEKGFHEAALLGQAVEDIPIDYAFCSQQIRTLETLEGILDASQQFDVPYERSAALNERDYGEYTGLNKWQVRDQIGEDAFNHLRRDWNYPVPKGETLKMVFERVIPFYTDVILPKLKQGKTVLLVSHGNAIRALMKFIENIGDQDIANVEMPFGNALLYRVAVDGHIVKKQERKIDTVPPQA